MYNLLLSTQLHDFTPSAVQKPENNPIGATDSVFRKGDRHLVRMRDNSLSPDRS